MKEVVQELPYPRLPFEIEFALAFEAFNRGEPIKRPTHQLVISGVHNPDRVLRHCMKPDHSTTSVLPVRIHDCDFHFFPDQAQPENFRASAKSIVLNRFFKRGVSGKRPLADLSSISDQNHAACMALMLAKLMGKPIRVKPLNSNVIPVAPTTRMGVLRERMRIARDEFYTSMYYGTQG